jgi:hypothetical protein
MSKTVHIRYNRSTDRYLLDCRIDNRTVDYKYLTVEEQEGLSTLLPLTPASLRFDDPDQLLTDVLENCYFEDGEGDHLIDLLTDFSNLTRV